VVVARGLFHAGALFESVVPCVCVPAIRRTWPKSARSKISTLAAGRLTDPAAAVRRNSVDMPRRSGDPAGYRSLSLQNVGEYTNELGQSINLSMVSA
jgi:hypothetical protein